MEIVRLQDKIVLCMCLQRVQDSVLAQPLHCTPAHLPVEGRPCLHTVDSISGRLHWQQTPVAHVCSVRFQMHLALAIVYCAHLPVCDCAVTVLCGCRYQYHPPFTLGIQRVNEVLFEVKEAARS
jgi:hypothetical protein